MIVWYGLMFERDIYLHLMNAKLQVSHLVSLSLQIWILENISCKNFFVHNTMTTIYFLFIYLRLKLLVDKKEFVDSSKGLSLICVM